MDVAEAFQIVIDLAQQNLIDKDDLPEEYARQVEAINIIIDVATNQFGDD